MRGAGLDNAAGVLCVLGAAGVLRMVEESMLEHDRRCLFVFPDRRTAGLQQIVGRGQLASAPLLGTVVVEGQAVDPAQAIQYEAGIGYAFHSSGGVMVPMNYQALTHDLALDFAQFRPAAAQYNAVHHTLVGREQRVNHSRVLGLMGPPLSRPHAGQEIVFMKDIQSSVWWLSCTLALMLNLVPSVTESYMLGR
mgnify:CR=1 FL=1